MDDVALVRAQYELPLQRLTVVSRARSTGRVIFRLDQADGPAWLGRAYRSDLPVPDWLAGCAADDTPSWLHSRAMTLRYLESLAYSAPRVIPDRSGALIGTIDGWRLLITTFVAGQAIDPTPESLLALGAALGQLHQLTIEPPDAPAPAGRSWWHVERAVPTALAQYATIAADLPPRWQPSAWRINALVAGYCEQRIPTPAERDALLAAIRFGVACGAATHFVAAHKEGWRNPLPEPLVRRQRWYDIAAPIAELALQQLDRLA